MVKIKELKTFWTYDRAFLCKILFGKVFFDHGPSRCHERQNSLYGQFSSIPEEDTSMSTAVLHRTCLRRMSPKKCVFGCEGNITLFSFPKNLELCVQWMQFVFPGKQQSFVCLFVPVISVMNVL